MVGHHINERIQGRVEIAWVGRVGNFNFLEDNSGEDFQMFKFTNPPIQKSIATMMSGLGGQELPHIVETRYLGKIICDETL